MKIFLYIIIAIFIYLYIIKKQYIIFTRIHHIYFWGTIASILLLCYFMKYHKFYMYKFFYNLKQIDEKPYFYTK